MSSLTMRIEDGLPCPAAQMSITSARSSISWRGSPRALSTARTFSATVIQGYSAKL